MYTGKIVVLVFHAKGEHQRPPGGAGRPGDAAIWPPPLSGRSGSPPEVGGGCVAPTEAVRGRPATLRPAAWFWLGLGLHHSGTLLTGPTLLLKLSWVLILRVVIGFGLNSTWFKPFGLDL